MLTVRGSITTPTTKVINITPLFPGRDIRRSSKTSHGKAQIISRGSNTISSSLSPRQLFILLQRADSIAQPMAIIETTTATARPINNSVRIPASKRLKMSRPSWSVPSRCLADGVCSMFCRLIIFAFGASSGRIPR